MGGWLSIFSPSSSTSQKTTSQPVTASQGGLAINTTGQVSTGLFGADLQAFLAFLKGETDTIATSANNSLQATVGTIQQTQNPGAAISSQTLDTIKQIALPVAAVIALMVIFRK